MASLLEYYNSPQSMGLLGLAAGLLEAGGPSQYPVSIGQGLSRGLLQGGQLAQNAAHKQLVDTYLGEQVKQLQTANNTKSLLAPIMQGIASRLAGAPNGMPSAGAGATMTAPPQATAGVPAPVAGAPGGQFPLSLEDVTLLKLIGGPDLTGAYNAGKPTDAQRNLAAANVSPTSEEGRAMLAGPAYAELLKLRNQPAEVLIPGTSIKVPTTQAIANAFNTGVANDDTAAMQAMLIASQYGIPKTIGVGHLPSMVEKPNAPQFQSEDERKRLGTGATTIGEGDAKRVLDLEGKIPSMLSVMRRLDRMEKLSADDQTYAAAGAELKTMLGSIAQGFGLQVKKEKTGNAEEYLAHVAELLKDRLASKDYGSGSGVSNLDLIAAKGPLPELAKTNTGRMQIIQALRADTERNLRDAQSARDYFDANNGLRGFRFPSEVQAEQEQRRRDLPKTPGTPPAGTPALPQGVTVKRIR